MQKDQAFNKIAEKIGIGNGKFVKSRWADSLQKYAELKNLDPNKDGEILKRNGEFIEMMDNLETMKMYERDQDLSIEDFVENDSNEDNRFEDIFIEEVKKHPVLFDLHDPDYKKTKVKTKFKDSQIGSFLTLILNEIAAQEWNLAQYSAKIRGR